MLEFKKLEYGDIETVRNYFLTDNGSCIAECSDIICDRIFGCTFFWRDFYNTRFTVEGDSLVLLITVGGVDMFSFPIGGNISAALSATRDYAHNMGRAAYFCFVPENDLHYFHENFDFVFVSEEPDWSDYVYDISDLMFYSGKKYHGQRNFYNRFSKMNLDKNFVPISSDNSADVIPFIKEWFEKYSDGSQMSRMEEKGIYELLTHWDSFSMKGGYLTADREIVGFTAGEIVGNTAFIQLEKADHRIPGSYQYLSAEYLKSIYTDSVKFVNREEDMGIPGLRKAKEDLHPIKKLKKFTLYCC